jgi:hypothetical protein
MKILTFSLPAQDRLRYWRMFLYCEKGIRITIQHLSEIYCFKVVVFDHIRSSTGPTLEDDSFHHGRIAKFYAARNTKIVIDHFGLVAADTNYLYTSAFD